MNRKFKHLEYSALLDQLAQHTATYTKLLNENGTTDQKQACQQTIRRILAEINIREKEEVRDPDNGTDPTGKTIR